MSKDRTLVPENLEDNLEVLHYLAMQQLRAFNIMSNLMRHIRKVIDGKGTALDKLDIIREEIERVERDIFVKGRGTWNIIFGKTNFRMQCALCAAVKRIEIHHIDKDQSNNCIENLIPLCRNCHTAVHAGEAAITEAAWEQSRIWRLPDFG